MTPQLPDELTIDTSPEFRKALRTLKERYRSIRKDLEPVIKGIQKGVFPGEKISGTGFVVYKARIKNRDIQKGKSAGYRLIYQIESESHVALLAIYSKSDEASISTQLIKTIIAEMNSDSD